MSRKRLKHRELVDAFRLEIESGRWGVGCKVSSTDELAQAYGTTKVTVGRAMQELVEMGLVERQRGKGTVVQPPRQPAAAVVFHRQIFDPGQSAYLASFLSQLEAVLDERGWRCRYFLDVNNDEAAAELRQQLERGQIDGVVVVSGWFIEHVMTALGEQMPPCVGLYPFSKLSQWVAFDARMYGDQGVRELAKVGCKQLALIASENPFPQIPGVEVGYESALADLGLDYEPAGVQMVPSTPDSGYEAFQALLRSGVAFDGVVVADEMQAMGVIRAAVEAGISVPGDLVIASHVTEGAGGALALPVIQLQAPVADQVDAVAEMLVSARSDLQISQRQFLRPNVVVPPVLASRGRAGVSRVGLAGVSAGG